MVILISLESSMTNLFLFQFKIYITVIQLQCCCKLCTYQYQCVMINCRYPSQKYCIKMKDITAKYTVSPHKFWNCPRNISSTHETCNNYLYYYDISHHFFFFPPPGLFAPLLALLFLPFGDLDVTSAAKAASFSISASCFLRSSSKNFCLNASLGLLTASLDESSIACVKRRTRVQH